MLKPAADQLMPTEPTRILHVSHTSAVSGAERSLLALMTALDPETEVGIVCPPGELAVRARAQGVPVYPISELRASLRLSPRQLPAVALRLGRSAVALRMAARSSGATVLHANSLRAGLIALGSRILGGPPVITHIRDVLPRRRVSLLLNIVIRLGSRHIVALSDYVKLEFTRLNVPGARVSVIDNPVDLGMFLPDTAARETIRRELGIATQTSLLGIVGQITSWKGHDTAVSALASLSRRHEDVRLLIVGEIKFADNSTRLDNDGFLCELQDEITRLNLGERVLLVGQREDIPAILTALDVLLVPSLEEPFGRTVAEAMAVGTPVVATTVGGPPELITDGVTGLLAPPGDPQKWAEAITRILDDPIAAASMAARARAVALQRFDAGRHAVRMLELLSDAR